MLKVEKNVPVPHRPNKGKRNPIWDEVVKAMIQAEIGDSVYVPRSSLTVAQPRTLTTSAFRYLTDAGGRGWYTTAVEGDGLRIWKIKEPERK